jgi:hypothetical protein
MDTPASLPCHRNQPVAGGLSVSTSIEGENPDAVVFAELGSRRFRNVTGVLRREVSSEITRLAHSSCAAASFNHGESLIRVFQLHCGQATQTQTPSERSQPEVTPMSTP